MTALSAAIPYGEHPERHRKHISAHGLTEKRQSPWSAGLCKVLQTALETYFMVAGHVQLGTLVGLAACHSTLGRSVLALNEEGGGGGGGGHQQSALAAVLQQDPGLQDARLMVGDGSIEAADVAHHTPGQAGVAG